MRILITNAYLLDMVGEEPNLRKAEILIENSIIKKIDKDLSNEKVDERINAKNMIVMPGLVNTHTHLAMSIFRGYKDDRKLMDWLENAIFPVEDKLEPEDIYWNSYLSCLEMIRSGTTTCNDMYFGMNKVIEALEKTGMRAVVSWSLTDTSVRDKPEKTREYAKKYNKPGSMIKIYVAPHAPYTCNPDTIKLCVDLAKELKTGIHIHLCETLDEEKTIKERYNKRGTEYLNDLNVFDVPVVLAHGIYINDSDIEVLKHIKGGISHNPISNCKLASGICDVVKLHKFGINVGLGTDGTGSTATLDLFEEMRQTAFLQKLRTMDPVSIKAYDVLKMATIEGAKVLGLDDQIGTVEVGKKADIIIINNKDLRFTPENDIATTIVYTANGLDVDTTIVDGKVLMENRVICGLNEDLVKQKVNENAKRLFS